MEFKSPIIQARTKILSDWMRACDNGNIELAERLLRAKRCLDAEILKRLKQNSKEKS